MAQKIRTDQVNIGQVLQVQFLDSTAVATGVNTNIPQDDTVPQNTEGTEYMTLSITPKSTTSTLIVEVTALFGCDSAGRNVIGALFRDSAASAFAANIEYNDDGAGIIPTILSVRGSVISGSTSPTTFKFRAGCHANATLTFNGNNSARLFGAITKSSIKITEVLI